VPCYSSVKTEIRDAERLAEALRAVGYEGVEVSNGGLVVETHGARLFQRSKVGEPFSSSQYLSNLDAGAVAVIGRKYAALSVQAFAKRRGFAVISDDGQRMKLVNRRG